MADITGRVEKVYQKKGTGRNGKPYTLYSAKVSGLNEWASFGFNDPKIQEGQVVKLRGEVDGSSFRVQQHKVLEDAPAKPAYSGSRGGNSGGGRDDYWKAKETRDIEHTQPRIQYQSSRKDALEFLRVLIDADALPVTAAQNKASKAKRFEELEEILDKLTVRFYHDVETLRVLKRVQDSDGSEASATPLPTAEPAEEEEDVVEDDFEDDEDIAF